MIIEKKFMISVTAPPTEPLAALYTSHKGDESHINFLASEAFFKLSEYVYTAQPKNGSILSAPSQVNAVDTANSPIKIQGHTGSDAHAFLPLN